MNLICLAFKSFNRNLSIWKSSKSLRIAMPFLSKEQVVAEFMSQVIEKPQFFNPARIVLTAGTSPAIEILSFCLADPGNAFLVPSPYYPE